MLPGNPLLQCSASMKPTSTRVIADLKEFKALTEDEKGAQRVAWGPVWRTARKWFQDKLQHELQLGTTRDGAGNLWATLPGQVEAQHRHRQPPRLGAGRRLARRLPGRHRRPRGAAAREGRGHAAADDSPGGLGRRRGRALRPQPAGLGGVGRRARRRTRNWRTWSTATASKLPDALAENGISLDEHERGREAVLRGRSTPRRTSSCTSSRARCWSR